MNKFKVGDLVRGTKGSPYSITNEDMRVGKVIAADDYGDIKIEVIMHTNIFHTGKVFVVASRYFEPSGLTSNENAKTAASKIILSSDNAEDIDWLTYKATRIVKRLSKQTGMPTEHIISLIIIGAEKLVEIEDGTGKGKGKGEEE